MVRVKEVMEKPILVSPTMTKKELLELVQKHPHTPIFVVVDTQNRFLGDIDEDDLFAMLLPDNSLPPEEVVDALGIEKKFFAQNAEQLMNKHDYTCQEEDDILPIAVEMFRNDLRALPVIREGKVAGVITKSVLLRHLGE